MHAPYKLMCILAHPDDESIALGGTIAKYADEGVEISLVVATRGERGWFGLPEENPGELALGSIRETELYAACRTLGVKRLDFLNYVDGDLDQADFRHIVPQLVHIVREVRPQVVITFGPDGLYGHPDHVAISQFTTAALLQAADATYDDVTGLSAYQVSKLYYRISSSIWFERFMPVFGDIVMTVDGVERRPSSWASWSITTRIDACAHWQRVWQAILCHQTQLQHKDRLVGLTEQDHHCFWGQQEFYRAFSLVNSGRQIESDLFAGLTSLDAGEELRRSNGHSGLRQTAEIIITPLQTVYQ
jgi:Uncharacterized proteins, LmbE homologs